MLHFLGTTPCRTPSTTTTTELDEPGRLVLSHERRRKVGHLHELQVALRANPERRERRAVFQRKPGQPVQLSGQVAIEGKRRRWGKGEGEEVEGHDDEQGSWREEAVVGSGRSVCHGRGGSREEPNNPFLTPAIAKIAFQYRVFYQALQAAQPHLRPLFVLARRTSAPFPPGSRF